MSITSLNFAVFTALTLVVYYALPRRAQIVWLLLASLAFTVTWSWIFAVTLLALSLANFGLGLALRRGGRTRPNVLILGLAVNCLVLLHFRLADFYVPQALALAVRLGLTAYTPALNFLVPVGVSYYTLQAISYLVDVYRGVCQVSTNVVDFLMYQAYFPKLLAGPIERARNFLPRLGQARPLENTLLARGVMLIVIGLVRKLVVADHLARLIPATAFYQPSNYSSPELLFFLLAYAIALYNDFAGYTSLARGVSALFGLELSANFLTPYFSRTFAEFWTRWHISLSNWLRDYIYFPLSRVLIRRVPNRDHWVHIVVPPMVTLLVSGLWHATWSHKTILLWGVLHGFYLVLERLAARGRPVLAPDEWPRWRQVWRSGLVFSLVVVAWLPFRDGSNISSMLAFGGGLLRGGAWQLPDLRIALVVTVGFALDWLQARRRDEYVFLSWPRPTQTAMLAIAALLLILSQPLTQAAPFFYQGF